MVSIALVSIAVVSIALVSIALVGASVASARNVVQFVRSQIAHCGYPLRGETNLSDNQISVFQIQLQQKFNLTVIMQLLLLLFHIIS